MLKFETVLPYDYTFDQLHAILFHFSEKITAHTRHCHIFFFTCTTNHDLAFVGDSFTLEDSLKDVKGKKINCHIVVQRQASS